MTRGRDGGAGAPPAKQRGLLAAVVAAIVAVSAAIYVGVAADAGAGAGHRDAVAGGGVGGGGAVSGGGGVGNNPAAPVSAGTWVSSWAAAPVGGEPGTGPEGLAGRSVRNIVHTSVGGSSARVTLSNLYGRSPLTVSHASVAISADPDTAVALTDSMRRLTFAGSPSVVIPAGGQVVSDVVRIAVPYDGDVLITTYSPVESGPVTYHRHARQISYVAVGEHTRDTSGVMYTGRSTVWRYVTALDVLSDEADGTVVVLGDSLTDGVTSTAGANSRWPDVLSDRLRVAIASGRDVPRYSVVNAGISGNQVLADGAGRGGRPAGNPSGLRRFERDVLERANVRVVVVVLGINDILRTPGAVDASRVVAGLEELVARAHARGVKVVGATLMPFGGHRGYTEAREAVRQRINSEIRAGGVFDAVVDFDGAVADPYDPRRLWGVYDSGDRLHPSDRGYRRMAEAVEWGALRGGAPAEL